MTFIKVENGVIVQKSCSWQDGFIEAPDDVVCGMAEDGSGGWRIPQSRIAQVKLADDASAAQKYLDSTDYLFTVDRHALLVEQSPEREAEVRIKREEAREMVRKWKAAQEASASTTSPEEVTVVP